MVAGDHFGEIGCETAVVHILSNMTAQKDPFDFKFVPLRVMLYPECKFHDIFLFSEFPHFFTSFFAEFRSCEPSIQPFEFRIFPGPSSPFNCILELYVYEFGFEFPFSS